MTHTPASTYLLLSLPSLIGQVALDDKLLGVLIQFPAVAVVVWLLIQQTKDRNRKDGEQNAMLREVVTAVVNSTKAAENGAEAIRGNTEVLSELRREMNGIRDTVACQHSIIEGLRTHAAAHNHTQRITLPGDAP